MEKRIIYLGLMVLALFVVSGLVEAQASSGNSLWQGLGSGSLWQSPSVQASAASSGSGFTVNYFSALENGSDDHAQPEVEPENTTNTTTPNGTSNDTTPNNLSSLLRRSYQGFDGYERSTRRIGVNFYKNPKAVDRNYVLSKDDVSCLGDNVSIQDTNASGEWYKKGGPTDSPPVEWVDDIEAVKQQIKAGTFKTTTYLTTLCSWPMLREAETGPSRCVFMGSLICQEKCKSSTQEGQSLNTTTEGQVEVTISCTPDCIFFAERKGMSYEGPMSWTSVYNGAKTLPDYYGYFVLTREPLPTLSYKQSIKIVDNSTANQTGPRIEVINPAYNPITVNKNTEPLRFILKNTGDMDAMIKNVALNVPFRIVYAPTMVSAGKEEEAILELTAENSTDLNLSVDYSSATLGCQPKKDFNMMLKIGRIGVIGGECLKDSDCPAKDLGLERMVCFNGICRDPAKGFANDVDGDGYAETWTQYK